MHANLQKLLHMVLDDIMHHLAMARPVVLTPGAATGIEARDGCHFAIAPAEGTAMLARITGLLGDPPRAEAMGQAARKFVIDEMSWESVERALSEILACAGAPHDAP